MIPLSWGFEISSGDWGFGGRRNSSILVTILSKEED
jgi:hypothetical protein